LGGLGPDRQTCGQHLRASGPPSNEAGCKIPMAAKDLHKPYNARPDGLILIKAPRLTILEPACYGLP